MFVVDKQVMAAPRRTDEGILAFAQQLETAVPTVPDEVERDNEGQESVVLDEQRDVMTTPMRTASGGPGAAGLDTF